MRPREVSAALGVSDATIRRYVRSGVLPQPAYLGGCRDWPESAVLDLRARRLAQARREVPPALSEGRRVRDEALELRGAAGEALMHAGVLAVRDALAPYTRLADVPVSERRRLIARLRRLRPAS